MMPDLNAERQTQNIVSKPMLLGSIPSTKEHSRNCRSNLRSHELNLQSWGRKVQGKTSFCMIESRHAMNQKKNQRSRRPVILYHADNQACTACKATM
jgi:hypothetical protein